ncbi:MAG: hypothetical protein ACSHXY_02770 [Alphaproteobacteria bacterium]
MNTENEKPAEKPVTEEVTQEAVVDPVEPIAKSKRVKSKKSKTPKPKPEKKTGGMGFGSVFVMSVLAAAFGALGGAALTYGLLEMGQLPAVASLRSDVQQGTETVATLKKDLAQLQASAQDSLNDIDFTPVTTRLEALEARPLLTENGAIIDPAIIQRLEYLEKALPAKGLTGINERITSLEKNLREQSKTSDAVPATLDPKIAARLDLLEQQNLEISPALDMAPLQERIEAVDARADTLEIDLTARLKALEDRAAILEAEQAQALRSAVPIPAFPKDAVLTALSSAGSQDQGLFKRTLSKHIKVQNENAIDRVTRIEALISSGNIDGAIADIRNLPQPGQDAAANWISIVNDIRSTP